MKTDDERPGSTGERKADKCTDRRGKHPSDGLAGKIQATQTTAPDGADWKDVLKVAWRAFEDDLDPATVWAGRKNESVDAWGQK